MATSRAKSSKPELVRNTFVNGEWYGPDYPDNEPEGEVLDRLKANSALWSGNPEAEAANAPTEAESTSGEG